MTNPLDPFIPSGGSGTSDVRVRALPKLEELVKAEGLASGLAQFDQQMENWRQELERTLNERLQGKPVVSTSTV